MITNIYRTSMKWCGLCVSPSHLVSRGQGTKSHRNERSSANRRDKLVEAMLICEDVRSTCRSLPSLNLLASCRQIGPRDCRYTSDGISYVLEERLSATCAERLRGYNSNIRCHKLRKESKGVKKLQSVCTLKVLNDKLTRFTDARPNVSTP